ncbi:MAG: glycoside hydrolase family 5 protein [Rhizobiaceae bacterium]
MIALATMAFAAIPSSLAAEPAFQAARGINMDQWVTWPSADRWTDDDALFPFPEWRRSVGREELAELRSAGLDFIRMPVDPVPFMAEHAAGQRERLISEVGEAVDMALEAGLKVIVDLHLIPGGTELPYMARVLNEADDFATYRQLVSDMASSLSGRDPTRVAFELMNEPGTSCDAQGNARWSDLQHQLHADARAAAPDTTLVLTGGCGGNASGLIALDPGVIADDNVIWTFHSYRPFILTHQGALWAGDLIRYVTGLPYPPHEADPADLDARLAIIRARIRAQAPMLRRSGMIAYVEEQLEAISTEEKLHQDLRAPFERVAGWADEHGISRNAILLGEFGMIRQEYGNPFRMPPQHRVAYYRDVIALAEEFGFPWAMWSHGGAFGIMQEFDHRPAEPDVMDMVRGLDRFTTWSIRAD